MWLFRVTKRQRRRISPRIKEELYKRQNGRCSYCRVSFELPYFDSDHKLPVVIGERGRRKQFRSARKVIVVVGTLAAIGLIAFPSSVSEGIFEGVSEVSQAITNIVSSLKLLGRP